MNGKVRLLIVDDSSFVRLAIARQMGADPEIEVVGFAHDGLEALEKVRELKPAVVTMDVTMPNMDGITALRHIMAECPTPVVMVSALTGDQAQVTFDALDEGAVDFFLKPGVSNPAGAGVVAEELRQKVKQAARIPPARLRPGMARRRPSYHAKPPLARHLAAMDLVIVVGSSTGGPNALTELLPAIPPDISAGILVVQHMPPGFTRSLADRLNAICQMEVKEAEPGDSLRSGRVLIAPGGYHMTVSKDGEIHLDQEPPVCGVRPSVDVTMASAASAYGRACLGVVLTGMGVDGTHGAEMIKASGGVVLAEDESTCAVYGMPRSVAEAGLADKKIPLPQIAPEVARLCRSRRPASEVRS